MQTELHVLNDVRAEIIFIPENAEEEKLLAMLREMTDTPPYKEGRASIRTLAGSNLFVIDAH